MLLASVTAFFAVSCQQAKNDQSSESVTENADATKELHDHVMQIHDEIMPKMDNIMKAKGQLQERLDSLRAGNGDESMITAIEEATAALSEADEAMMQWMRSFKPPQDGTDEQTIKAYYTDQEEKIKTVKDQMYSSLEEAERILKGSGL